MNDSKYQPDAYQYGKLARTYRLRPETVKALDILSEGLEVGQSALVELFLQDGLSRLKNGEIELTRRPVKYEVHLASGGEGVTKGN